MAEASQRVAGGPVSSGSLKPGAVNRTFRRPPPPRLHRRPRLCLPGAYRNPETWGDSTKALDFIGQLIRTSNRRPLMPDHVPMMISIPPKYAVSQVIGFIKGKSAIHLARVYGERKRNFVGQHFWARGYFVSTVGRDEAVIREYIQKQEQEDLRLDQMNSGADHPPSGGSNTTGPRQRPQQPLRAATSPRPPALPGDTYSKPARRKPSK